MPRIPSVPNRFIANLLGSSFGVLPTPVITIFFGIFGTKFSVVKFVFCTLLSCVQILLPILSTNNVGCIVVPIDIYTYIDVIKINLYILLLPGKTYSPIDDFAAYAVANTAAFAPSAAAVTTCFKGPSVTSPAANKPSTAV